MYLFFRFILVIFSSVKEAGTQFRCSDFSFVVWLFWHLFFFLSFVQKRHLELCAFIRCCYSNCYSYWMLHLWPHSGNDLHQVPVFTIFFPSWFNLIVLCKDSRIFDNFHLQLKLLHHGREVISLNISCELLHGATLSSHILLWVLLVTLCYRDPHWYQPCWRGKYCINIGK